MSAHARILSAVCHRQDGRVQTVTSLKIELSSWLLRSSGGVLRDLTADAPSGAGVYRIAHNKATSKVLRPQTKAPMLVTLDDGLESVVKAGSGEEVLDWRRALKRYRSLIRPLGSIDRQIMLLYLEQLTELIRFRSIK